MGGLPIVCYGFGALALALALALARAFSRYQLGEVEHRRIRAALDERSATVRGADTP